MKLTRKRKAGFGKVPRNKIITALLTGAAALVLIALVLSAFRDDPDTNTVLILAVLFIILLILTVTFGRIRIARKQKGYLMPKDEAQKEETEIEGKLPNDR